MQYVYVLKSKKDCKLYAGCTNNTRKRSNEHNEGKVISRKGHGPFGLLCDEASLDEKMPFGVKNI
jgi:putative endonuclease